MKPIPWAEAERRFGIDSSRPSRTGAVPENHEITSFATDSREATKGSLFIAIRGAQVDGHKFVDKVLEAGAAGSLVEEPVRGPHILVPNVVEALANFARSYREDFTGPVVGITGSVGKTTTKELIAAALSPLGRVLATQGNRNTEFTAPLLWPEINEGDVSSVVVEMGMRGFGQIAHLADFSRPTIGLITNIGHSHLELVESRAGIARAKRELFDALPADGIAIAPAEDDFIDYLREKRPVQTFGFGPSDARIVEYQTHEDWTANSTIEIDGERYQVKTPAGRHLALAAASALLVARAAGADLIAAAEAVSQAKLPPMRMEIRHALGQEWVLDMYNAAPNSVKVALETLRDLRGDRPVILVLGEMRELGAETENAHREVGRRAAEFGGRVIALNALRTPTPSPDGEWAGGGELQSPSPQRGEGTGVRGEALVENESLRTPSPSSGRGQGVGQSGLRTPSLTPVGEGDGVPAPRTSNPDSAPASYIVEEAGPNAILAQSHDQVRQILESLPPGHLILVKGSRAVALENALPEGVLA